jgi:hypothetical protein
MESIIVINSTTNHVVPWRHIRALAFLLTETCSLGLQVVIADLSEQQGRS